MPERKHKTVIVIAGPTAVGKTDIAIRLAKEFDTKIVSADSRQCFRELNVGVAKPTPAQLSEVQHYFISSHSIQDNVNAATFEQYALHAVDNIFQQSDIAIVVGGTGLYIKAFCEGLDAIPEIPEDVRKHVIEQYQTNGISFLQNELKGKDPWYWNTAEQQNPQRLMRALEVLYATGHSILSYQNKKAVQRPFSIIKVGLELPREALYNQINHRVDEMIEQGLVDEVKSLLPYKHLNALQTVGYKELFDYLHNKTTLEKAIELIKQNTRHYAKRQMTWFKKDERINWFSPLDFDAILLHLQQALQSRFTS